jgi:coenzyme Q-binding protein COQ10
MPTRREQRHLRYTPPQLFDLVADVEKYPKFIPGLVAVRVLRREEDTMWIDMTIGLSIFEGRLPPTGSYSAMSSVRWSTPSGVAHA